MHPVHTLTTEDPRQTKAFVGPMLHHRAGYANDRRIALSHATEKSRLTPDLRD